MSILTRTQKISALTWLFFVFSVFFSASAPLAVCAEPTFVAAPEPVFIVRAEPGTQIYRMAGADKIIIGTVGEDGVFVAARGVPAGTHTFIFEHADAQEPYRAERVSLKIGEVTKLNPELKMRTGELMVTCLPADVALFVDGELKGQGALMLGNLPIGKEVTIEARSSVYGVQSRRVKVRAGETTKVNFDLRGNIPAQKPDGKIVLPDVPLVLALQQGAVVRVDGVPAQVTDGALTELAVGARVVEVFLPLKDRLIPVWRGALAARSAIMPGADLPAVPVDVPAAETPKAEPVNRTVPAPEAAPAASEKITGKVEMVVDQKRFRISMSKHTLKDGATCKLVVALGVEPLHVRLTTVTASGALATLEKSPEGYELKEGATFVLEPNE